MTMKEKDGGAATPNDIDNEYDNIARDMLQG